MIHKLDNGNAFVQLGEGTVHIGNVSTQEKKPFGIYISNEPGVSEDAIIIGLSNNKAIASYVMALVNYLEAHIDEDTDQTLVNSLHELRDKLEPMMPKV